jgi:predicted deacylase
MNRSNLPQIRAYLEGGQKIKKMAMDFGAPVTMDEPLREGSLREYCANLNIPVILYEGGEALRYSEKAISYAVDGVLNVMTGLGMIEKQKTTHVKSDDTRHMIAASHWIRSPQSGLLISDKKLGDMVEENDILGHITDAFNNERAAIISPAKGIIIGATTTPLLNQGDAAYHIAHYG